MNAEIPFTIASLRDLYRSGKITVDAVIDEALRRATNTRHPNVWISLLSREQIAAFAAKLDIEKIHEFPLFGVPFAIKDNIALTGVPMTCACPAFAQTPSQSATVVERLIAAGAIPIGKTNLDQFATGLVGTRSPYGACSSVFDPNYISGGSSSGSGVAVAAGMVAFALGTDTAGSGRVPAAFNHIVGLKPTKGLASTCGVFPACHSLDCVSVFAGTCADAQTVLSTIAAHDEVDYFSRTSPQTSLPEKPRIGIPAVDQLEFFGDEPAKALFASAVEKLKGMGMECVEIDFTPFRNAARLLYEGPWVAERRHALGEFLTQHGDAMDPTVRGIISGAESKTAMDVFDGIYQLQALKAASAHEWLKMDVLLLPTTGTIYTIAEVQADPVQLNTNLGYYTNFVNLLDLAAVSVPAGFRPNNLPFGITLLAPAFTDYALLALGDLVHRNLTTKIGNTNVPLGSQPPTTPAAVGEIHLAVAGAHLSGQPLNHQLTSRNARLIKTTRTAKNYRLYALANTTPPKPGLVRVADPAGDGIELEVWALSPAAFGSFVAEAPSPMTIGTVTLADDTTVKSFLCEPAALEGATDITQHGSWRTYLAAQ